MQKVPYINEFPLECMLLVSPVTLTQVLRVFAHTHITISIYNSIQCILFSVRGYFRVIQFCVLSCY